MKISFLSLMAIGFAVPVFAETAPFQMLDVSGLNFSAPIVNNASNYTNVVPVGTIFFDVNTGQFVGLDNEGHWDSMTIPGASVNVTSNTSGQERIERASIVTTSTPSCTINSQSGLWISSTTPNSLGDCTLNIAAGEWTSTPTCTVTITNQNPATSYLTSAYVYSVSTSTLRVAANFISSGSNTVNASPGIMQIICMGPH